MENIGTVSLENTVLRFTPAQAIAVALAQSGYVYATFTLQSGATGSKADINGQTGIRLQFNAEQETWGVTCSGLSDSDLYHYAPDGTYDGLYRIAVFVVRQDNATPEPVGPAQTIQLNFTKGGGTTTGPPPPPW